MIFDAINTPAVLIDREIVDRNIVRFQQYCAEHRVALRPHIKTHKLVELARQQVAAGAVGINCQKLGEAEVMAAHGLDDILITYNIIGASNLARLLSLSSKVNKLSVTADSRFTLQGLSATFAQVDKPLEVLVECDTGGRRCGVQTPDAAVELAQQIAASPGLVFGGLMTYPAKGGTAAVQRFMSRAKHSLQDLGMSCPIITSGGSPDMWQVHEAPIVNEYRVGTYVYNDRSLVVGGTCGWDDCALSVLTTVVSVPAPGRAIIDAGSKALSSDLLGLDGFGHVVDYPDVRIVGLSEEHGHLEYSVDDKPLQLGHRLRVIPNHACVVSNLFDEVTFVRAGKLEKTVPVDARGCST